MLCVRQITYLGNTLTGMYSRKIICCHGGGSTHCARYQVTLFYIILIYVFFVFVLYVVPVILVGKVHHKCTHTHGVFTVNVSTCTAYVTCAVPFLK